MLDWQPKVNTYDQSTSAFSGGIDKNGSAQLDEVAYWFYWNH